MPNVHQSASFVFSLEFNISGDKYSHVSLLISQLDFNLNKILNFISDIFIYPSF